MWAVLGAKRREILISKLVRGAIPKILAVVSIRAAWQFYLDRFFGLLSWPKRVGGKKEFNKLFFLRIIF